MRGSFPQDIFYNRTADQFTWLGTLEAGIPQVPVPDLSSGRVRLPQGVFMRSPNPTDVDRGIIQQWNVAYEYRLPWDIAAEVAYVGTRTDGGYADLNLNFGDPGGGNAARRYFALAGTTAVLDWAARTKSRYHGLQIALNRPFKNNLLLKGGYTFSRSKNMTRDDEDGWTDLTWNHPLMYDRNFTIAGFDRPHVLQLGFVVGAAVPAAEHRRPRPGARGLAGQRRRRRVLGHAVLGPRHEHRAELPGLRQRRLHHHRRERGSEADRLGRIGDRSVYYALDLFSQPTGANVAGFGNSGRNRFRRPGIWNVDMSLFKAFQIGRWRPEFRLEAANVFNHTSWGRPVVTYTANNFMRFTPQSTVHTDGNNQLNTPGPRRIQIGLRTQF